MAPATGRTLLVFDDSNPMPDRLDGAPTVNGQFGTGIGAVDVRK